MLADRRRLWELLRRIAGDGGVSSEHLVEVSAYGARLAAVRRADARAFHLAGIIPCDGEISAILSLSELLKFVEMGPGAEEGQVELMSVEDGQIVVATDGRMVTLPSIQTTHLPSKGQTEWSSMEGLEL